jgi:hypothetical protein
MVAGVALGIAAFAVIAAIAHSRSDEPDPADLPTVVQAFASALPEAQEPNAAGLTVVSSTSTGPAVWQVEWVTRAKGFCFAAVSAQAPAATTCSAPGVTTTAGQSVTIVGHAGDYVFGFIQGAATYVAVSVDSGETTLTAAQPIGSGLTGYYAQLPDSWASPEPYTVTAYDQGGGVGSATA